MNENDYSDENLFLTISEMKAEFPKAARVHNWSSKMFYYLNEAGLLTRKFNHSIKTYVYSKRQFIKILRMVNDNLDDLHIDLGE